jgi:hypothetical protein
MLSSTIPNQHEKFQKYFDFFMRLEQQPIKNKASFLVKEKNNINALLYELTQNRTSGRLTDQY